KKYSERMRPPRPTINYESQSANQMRTSPSNALKPTFSAELVSKGWPRDGADQTIPQNLPKHIAIQAIVPIRQRLGAHLLLATQRNADPTRRLLLLSKHSAPQIAASQEAVPASFGGVVSFDLINAFATNRTTANMNPTTAVPYITEAGS